MTQTYQIYDTETGAVLGVQTWDDYQSPVLLRGQAARVIPSNVVASGMFTSASAGASVELLGQFNVSLWGTFSATVVLERSFDGGATFLPVGYPDGTFVSFAGPASGSWDESETGVIFRLRASTYASGTVNWRLSR